MFVQLRTITLGTLKSDVHFVKRSSANRNGRVTESFFKISTRALSFYKKVSPLNASNVQTFYLESRPYVLPFKGTV